MLRKISLAAATAIVLGTAAFVPTSASAWYGGYHHRYWHHGYWHHGWWGWHRPYYYGAYGYGCRRWVETPWGPRLRWVC